MSVIVITDLTALEAYLPALEELAADAIEPSVFYEPWILQPSLKAFGAGQQFVFALVFAPAIGNPQEPQILCGFFPLVRERRYKGLPISVLRLWQHLYSPLCTPLIRPEHANECLKAFFKWLADPDHPSAANCAVVELRYINGDGPFYTLLVDYLYNSAQLVFMEDSHVRAFFRPAENAEVYLSKALSRRRRKDLRLQGKHLAEAGQIEYSELTEQDDVDQWMSDFLCLEASGWKGKEGSAIASKKADLEFFLEAASEGFRRGRLSMLSLNINGRSIAQKLDFTSGRARFALKMAYDESYSRFSPGVLLELENLRRLHEKRQIDWVDSCAVPEHFMMNRLYTSRRVIQTVLVATGRKPGGLFVSVLPL
ncbi:MAG: GNAT family N-acetyltransferase, partial [Acidobacteriales bacterium]|nr:GNAT family N-acetyltransferase [Terriglobales bacterium]